MAVEKKKPTTPISFVVGTQRPCLFGCFFCGAVGVSVIANEFVPIANDGIAVALIQGDIDGVALSERAQSTFDKIQTPPKALITVMGANHFSISNVNNP